MLRGPARVKAKRLLQVPDRPLPLLQQLKDAHPHRMAEDPEKLPFEHIDGMVERHQIVASRRTLSRTAHTVEHAEAVAALTPALGAVALGCFLTVV